MLRYAMSLLTILSAGLLSARAAHAQYRGMAAGWPSYASGSAAAYYAPSYGQPMYYVARPIGAPAAYAPVTAAYANPAYFGAYNAPATYAQRPATTAYYAPPARAAYYAPTTAAYAPSHSYSVSPAGGVSAGAEAYSGYGQPTAVNYVPPRFVYRTTYAAVPVYSYRPVTVYDPVTSQPVTCLQPATTTQCQTQRQRWFSHSWFNWWKPSCGSGGCGPAPATTSYCTSGYCGQPYYPVQPQVVIPTVPAPTRPGTIITQPLPGGLPAGPTVPSPPTRFGVPGGAAVPADVPPTLSPDRFTPRPAPGATNPTFPVDPIPGGALGPSPATPFTPPAGGGFGAPFPSGANYPPISDPYTSSSASRAVIRQPQRPSEQATADRQSPPVGPAPSPATRPVPDPDAQQEPRPINRAPQLLDPRDKTAARGDQRWAVVPAVWPQQPAAQEHPYRVVQERSHSEPGQPAVIPSEYDDGGWKSARTW
jgi:hypothetical protein